MALPGKFKEFKSVIEDWPQYVNNLVITSWGTRLIMPGEVHSAIYLQSSAISVITYKLQRSLVAPQKPSEKSYEELISALTTHFSPTPSPIVCQFKFHSHYCQPGESVAVFVSQLHSLSENCGFGDTLEDMLRDQVVCGIQDDEIQRCFLTESNFKFAKAVELAQSMEQGT